MGLFNSNKTRLLEWQNIIVQGSPNKLIVSEKQLEQITKEQAANCLRIIEDCTNIISSTVKPDTFFMRLDLLKRQTKQLVLYEKYIKFQGASPSLALNQIEQNEQQCIHDFLFRYLSSILNKVDSLKTENAKKKQFQKFYDSLQSYFFRMNDSNIDYVKTKYQAYTR